MASQRDLALWTVFLLMLSVTAKFNTDDESWNLDTNYRNAHSGNILASANLTNDLAVQKIRWSGIEKCNVPPPIKTKDHSTDDVLPQASTCPWNWVINYDPRRTPSTLLEAHCACQTCRSKGIYMCQPVHYFRKVTYFKDTEDEKTQLFRLAVGCTCERHSSHPDPQDAGSKLPEDSYF